MTLVYTPRPIRGALVSQNSHTSSVYKKVAKTVDFRLPERSKPAMMLSVLLFMLLGAVCFGAEVQGASSPVAWLAGEWWSSL